VRRIGDRVAAAAPRLDGARRILLNPSAEMASAAGSSLLLDEFFEGGDERFLDELLRFDGEKRLAVWAERLQGDPRPFARRALLAYIDDGCDRDHHRPLVKRLFKRCEAAGDDEAMAHFLVAFDRLNRRTLQEVLRWDWTTRESYPDFMLARVPLGGPREHVNLMTGDKITVAGRRESFFGTATRAYLVRRAWRYFRLLGWRDQARYGRAIRIALPLYQEAALAKAENLLDAWGLLHALYHGSPVLRREPRGITLRPGRTLAELEPAPFKPEVWMDCRDELFALVETARSRTVRAWAIAWLRKHYDLGALPIARLRVLLRSQHDEVQVFGVELLKNATGLDSLSVADWLELLEMENPVALPILCELMAKRVSPARLTVAECVKLARAQAAPVAALGLAWLREKRSVPLGDVVGLGDAPVPTVRTEAVAWLIDRIREAPDARPEHLRELIDARHADTRQRALETMAKEPRFRDQKTLWAALPESPYDDVRAQLVAHLEERRTLLPAGSLKHVWVTALLAVHRGGKAKPGVARQIARRIVEDPAQAPELLPLLGIALRSLRQPEKRAALAALVRAAETRPALRAQVTAGLPELSILDDAGTARASVAGNVGGGARS
jgi:hypothetical protein